MTDQVNPIVSLSRYLEQGHTLQKDKEKRPILNHPLNPADHMNFIIWNTGGDNSTSFRRQCEVLVKTHNSTLVVLLETKMVDHKHLIEILKFDSHLESSVVSRRGGIVIIWMEDTVKL